MYICIHRHILFRSDILYYIKNQSSIRQNYNGGICDEEGDDFQPTNSPLDHVSTLSLNSKERMPIKIRM